MKTLYVELGERRYPIFIGSNLNPQELLEPYIHGKQVMIVSNDTVAPLYLDRYKAAFAIRLHWKIWVKLWRPVFCRMVRNTKILSI